jgi:hypothetical protein
VLQKCICNDQKTCNVPLHGKTEKLKDTKVAIRSRKSKNREKTITSNGPQINTQKIKTN